MNTKENFEFIISRNAIDELIRESKATNWEIETMGGPVFWNVIAEINGWKLQQNKITGLVRILNPSNIRKLWGTKSYVDGLMDLTVSRLKSNNFLLKDEDNIVGKIEKLKILLGKGLISEEEFERKKSNLLDQI